MPRPDVSVTHDPRLTRRKKLIELINSRQRCLEFRRLEVFPCATLRLRTVGAGRMERAG